MSRKKNLSDYSSETPQWVSAKSLDDRSIEEYACSVLSTPTVEGKELRLYSKDKMLEMFRIGYYLRTDYIKDTRRRKRAERPYIKARCLKVGETCIFPFTAWDSVRVACSMIKRKTGSTFRVRKLAPSGLIGDIEMTRLS